MKLYFKYYDIFPFKVQKVVKFCCELGIYDKIWFHAA